MQNILIVSWPTPLHRAAKERAGTLLPWESCAAGGLQSLNGAAWRQHRTAARWYRREESCQDTLPWLQNSERGWSRHEGTWTWCRSAALLWHRLGSPPWRGSEKPRVCTEALRQVPSPSLPPLCASLPPSALSATPKLVTAQQAYEPHISFKYQRA